MTNETWHGTANGYKHHKCRCVDCRAAKAAYSRAHPTRRDIAEDDPRHGSPSTYTNQRCRCAACTEAWRVYAVPRIKRWRAARGRP
jgi:hypothetical protein